MLRTKQRVEDIITVGMAAVILAGMFAAWAWRLLTMKQETREVIEQMDQSLYRLAHQQPPPPPKTPVQAAKPQPHMELLPPQNHWGSQ